MMKRLFPTALAVLLLLLAGCTAKPDTSNQSKPAEYYLTDTDLPLDDAARLRAAPDFLTAGKASSMPVVSPSNIAL